MMLLYKESLGGEEEYQELNEKKLEKQSEIKEASPLEESKIPEETNKKKATTKKAPRIMEDIRGSHNEFMGQKDVFDMKRFIDSVSPEVKGTQKEKVLFLCDYNETHILDRRDY